MRHVGRACNISLFARLMATLSHILTRLNLNDNQRIFAKASELLNQINVKVPSSAFRNAGNAKTVICIHLACNSLNEPFNPSHAPPLSSCTTTTYTNALAAVRKSLNLQTSITFDSLAVRFGCTQVTPKVKHLWDTFRQQYEENISAASRVAVQREWERSVWIGAVFYVCCRYIGIRIERKKIESDCSCTATELNRTTKQIESTCKKELNILSTLAAGSSSPKRGRPLKRKADEVDTLEVYSKVRKEEKKKKVGDKLEEKEEGMKEVEIELEKDVEKATEQENNTKFGWLEETNLENSMEKQRLATVTSAIVPMIRRQSYKETKRYSEYLDWREKVLENIKQSA